MICSMRLGSTKFFAMGKTCHQIVTFGHTILIDATEDFSLQADLASEHRRYADELWLRDSAYV
jgi:hypothetical protein